MAKKELQTQEEQNKALALGSDFDFGSDVGAGMEGADKDSFAIPFLRALQKISPQVDEADAEYIEGAKPGMLYNSVTKQLFDGKDGLFVLPCAYQRRFLKWGPRGTSEGGYKGEFLPEDIAAMLAKGEVREQENRIWVPDANGEVNVKKCDHFADTRSHFVLIYDPTTCEVQQALLALSSTQIKKSKQLMSLLNNAKVQTANGMVTPPTWMNIIKITTVLESNDQGSWYGLRIEPAGFIDRKDVYDAGKAFHAAIAAGEAKANYAAMDDAAAGPKEGDF